MFKSTHNKGFHMTFKNGFTISVQFGTSSYCSRRNYSSELFPEMKMEWVGSPDAEIAIWDADGEWFSFGYDNVKGYCSADEVATWIIFCTAATSMEDLRERALNSGMLEQPAE